MGKKSKGYDIKASEEKWKKFWEKEKIYKADTNKGAYSIDTPPPTVSGNMHVGHAFSYSQEDFMARYRRMNGGVFYPFGTDDNGLPTEKLIERLKKVKSKDMSRADFIELCLATLKEITPDFIQDWKDLGVSADYETTYSTIDDNSRKISQKSFIDLYKAEKVYKKEFPQLWCPDCQTAIAQAELEDKNLSSHFTTISFKSGGKDLNIATTRPELLPACVAIFVNPDDKRYKKLVGKKAKIPLVDREVPILADESADMEKGTGALMVCSYGDRYDVDAIQRHKLEPEIIINEKGLIFAGPYSGLGIKEARKKILSDLEEAGFVKEKKQLTHAVNVHDKCGTEIEFITTEQWFIKVLDQKKELIKQGKKINWYPAFMRKRYENWVEGLEWDWSISRDRHFGIPIPVWHCKTCSEVILAEEKELPIDPIQTEKVCSKCGGNVEPEEKVLDTWATSSLTPQIASSLFGNKVKIPYSLRPQAHDIIRTWAFYTIVKSLYHENEIPWKDIIVSGFVTLGGEKMSKSKGKGVDPKEVIDKYGSDALRFWAASSKLGEDLDYQEKDLVTGKKFLTKIFNASKFVFMHLENFDGKKPKLEKVDEQFLAKLNSVILGATESFEIYEYSKVKASVEGFFWRMFCDNYLEMIKDRIYNAKGESRKSAQYVLYQSLLAILKMMAPITPFITEEIYQTYFRDTEKDKSIHISPWPKGFSVPDDSRILDKFVEILEKVRYAKSAEQKSVKAEINLTLTKEDLAIVKPALDDLRAVTTATDISEGKFNVEFL